MEGGGVGRERGGEGRVVKRAGVGVGRGGSKGQ